MPRKITVGDVCFIRKEGKILLLRRDREPLRGKWTGVGGKTRFFEEPLESCTREVKEETGLDVLPELAGVITTINIAKGEKWLLFAYIANSFKGELKKSKEGILEWVDEKKLHARDLVFIGVALPYILDRKRKDIITGKIIHDGNKVLSCILREKKKTIFEISNNQKFAK